MPCGLEIVDIHGVVRAFGYVADEICGKRVSEINSKRKNAFAMINLVVFSVATVAWMVKLEEWIY